MLILIDGNAMGHAHHNATKLTHGDMQTQAIYGFMRMLRDISEAYPKGDCTVFWDGRAQFRYDAYPEYKSNRDVSDDPKKAEHRQAYRAQVPYIKLGTKLLGVRQMVCQDLEADDLAGWMVRKFGDSRRILLVTGDQDWLQLVGPNVTWLDPRGEGKKVTLETFQESTGYFTPEEFLHGKCLHGDSSDTIKGVGGIGLDGAPVFMAEHRSVYTFIDKVLKGEIKPKKKAHRNLALGEGRAIFDRNMALMNLRSGPDPSRDKLEHTPGKFDEELFRRFCERLAFMSILRDFERFVDSFRKRQVSKT